MPLSNIYHRWGGFRKSIGYSRTDVQCTIDAGAVHAFTASLKSRFAPIQNGANFSKLVSSI